MSLQSPIARARGLGSAHDGAHHWWMQRLSAVILVPLSLWFAVSIATMASADYLTVAGWVAQPWVALALIIYFGALFYHSQLGVQVVIEDYVHGPKTKLISMFLMKTAHLVLGVATILAVLRIALA